MEVISRKMGGEEIEGIRRFCGTDLGREGVNKATGVDERSGER